MSKEFVNKMKNPVISQVQSVSLNKTRTGILIETVDYLCYLPISSKNAFKLLDLVSDYTDSEAGCKLFCSPATKEKHGFKLVLSQEPASWILESETRYVCEDPETEESDWFTLEKTGKKSVASTK